MSARSGLVGKNPPGPIWGHLGPFFAWAGKMQKLKIRKIKIRSAQNVSKVWISRNKNPPGPIWGHLGQFFAWAGKITKKCQNFGTWKSGNVGSKKILKVQILKIQIHSAQNVGKVWISRKNNFPAPFGAIPGHFLRGPEKCKKCKNKKMLSVLQESTHIAIIWYSTRRGPKL